MALKLRDPDTSADGTGGRRQREWGAGWYRRALFLRGLSLSLAFMLAGLVLSLVVGSMREQDAAVETAAAPEVAWSPSAIPEAMLRVVMPGPVLEAAPEAAPVPAPGFDAEALRDELEEIASGHGGVYGVAVLDPASRTGVSLLDEEEFMVASIGKLPVLAALYKAAARGELDLEEEISVLPGDVQWYGSGGLQGFPGYSLSLRECAYRLIQHSDNTAWAMLDRRLGEERIRAELKGMGIEDSVYSDYLSGYYTTPLDVLLLLERISDPRFTDTELSAEMLDAMTQTAFEDRIPERLPRDVRVAHKTGSYGDNFGDAGVVFYNDKRGVERRYYLVVLSKGAGEYEAREVMQSMSLAVYEALSGVWVDRGWSRGNSTLLEGPTAALVPPAQGGAEGYGAPRSP